MAYGTVDLFNIIFQEILKIDWSLLSKYYTIQDQIIYLIFLPHVVLLLFLWGFGQMIVPPPGGNKGLRYLIIAAAYIFIVYQGWYGTFLVPLLQTWFTYMLIFGLFLFFVTKFFHPLTARNLGRTVGTKLGASVGKQIGKGKAIEALEKEKDHIRKKIQDRQAAMVGAQPAVQHALQIEINHLQDQIRDIEKEIDKLGG